MPTVRTNGIRTYYEAYGEGPPVVFLHGAGSDHRLWAEQAEPLADDYRVIVYDFRGHGRSGGTDADAYAMDDYVEDLRALLAELDLDRPVVCGLSMGGMVALAYAAEHPDTIAGVCTLGTQTPEILTRGEWVDRRLVPTVIDTLSTVVARERLEGALHRINLWRFGEEAAGDIDALERIQAEHESEYPEIDDAEWEKVRAMLESYDSIGIDYSAITVPMLAMYGELELSSMARHARYLVEVAPDAEARGIPDAGHNSHVDNPEFIVETLREFLGRVHGRERADGPAR